MTEQHPITPPPELVEQWANDSVSMKANAIGKDWEIAFASRAAQWGADQELEACCEWFSADAVSEVIDVVSDLRAARRPKPPSLRKQAISNFDHLMGELIGTERYKDRIAFVRRALEALPND